MIIGLTGYRESGKSTIAQMIVEEFGFVRVHSFAPGLAATKAYWESLGVNSHTAHRMVYGDLKDTPFKALKASGHLVDHTLVAETAEEINASLDQYLPGESSRDFMEKFGNWLGTEMGPDYTLLAEIRSRIRVDPTSFLIVESVVYEVEALRRLGARIIRVDRPGVGPRGLRTDGASQPSSLISCSTTTVRLRKPARI